MIMIKAKDPAPGNSDAGIGSSQRHRTGRFTARKDLNIFAVHTFLSFHDHSHRLLLTETLNGHRAEPLGTNSQFTISCRGV
jgi:hypothetical protein